MVIADGPTGLSLGSRRLHDPDVRHAAEATTSAFSVRWERDDRRRAQDLGAEWCHVRSDLDLGAGAKPVPRGQFVLDSLGRTNGSTVTAGPYGRVAYPSATAWRDDEGPAVRCSRTVTRN